MDERLERITHPQRRAMSQDGRIIDTYLTDQMRMELQEKPIKHVHYHYVRPITSEVEHGFEDEFEKWSEDGPGNDRNTPKKKLMIRCFGKIPKYYLPVKDCPKPLCHQPYPALVGDDFDPKPVSDAEFGESIPEKVFFKGDVFRFKPQLDKHFV